MAYGTMKKKPTVKKSTRKAAFKPCKGCPAPAKCKKMGRCMKKGK